jgi:hypothetical protein
LAGFARAAKVSPGVGMEIESVLIACAICSGESPVTTGDAVGGGEAAIAPLRNRAGNVVMPIHLNTIAD